MIREAERRDLGAMLRLYAHLSGGDEQPLVIGLTKAWNRMLANPGHHVIVYEKAGEIISSCVCVIIPNITHSVRPYAVIENVVTHPDHRRRGCARACLDRAVKLAECENCYKIMLLSGAENTAAHALYRSSGFNTEDKTAFVKWLE